MNATEFRNALAALGMTQADLRRELDAVRGDGEKTSRTTISNMATGKAAVNPWLILYLHTLAKMRGVDLAVDVAPVKSPAQQRTDAMRKTLEAMRAARLTAQPL